jgi:hypothetical protein
VVGFVFEDLRELRQVGLQLVHGELQPDRLHNTAVLVSYVFRALEERVGTRQIVRHGTQYLAKLGDGVLAHHFVGKVGIEQLGRAE